MVQLLYNLGTLPLPDDLHQGSDGGDREPGAGAEGQLQQVHGDHDGHPHHLLQVSCLPGLLSITTSPGPAQRKLRRPDGVQTTQYTLGNSRAARTVRNVVNTVLASEHKHGRV